MTAGVMRGKWQIVGVHVHCAVFGPDDGKTGELIFRLDEFVTFAQMHPDWRFTSSEHVVSKDEP